MEVSQGPNWGCSDKKKKEKKSLNTDVCYYSINNVLGI
jgi:hypothetical protein